MELVGTRFAEVSQKACVPVWPDAIITYLQGNRRNITCDEWAVNYWAPHIDKAILYLTQAVNAAIYGRIPDILSLTVVPIEWVPLADLAVPPSLSYIGDTPMIVRKIILWTLHRHRFQRRLMLSQIQPVLLLRHRPYRKLLKHDLTRSVLLPLWILNLWAPESLSV